MGPRFPIYPLLSSVPFQNIFSYLFIWLHQVSLWHGGIFIAAGGMIAG